MSYYDYDSDCYNYKEICEKALAFNATQEDISKTLARMREEGGTGSRMTCLMFGELFETRP